LLLKRRKRLRRKKRIAPVNEDRRDRLRREAFGVQASFCRTLPCCVCEAPAPSDPAHVRSRGAGGRDRENVVPLCREHHVEQHSAGIETFGSRYGVDLSEIAVETWSRLVALGLADSNTSDRRTQ